MCGFFPLGRFIQPDSIIPDPGSANGFDRYAYVNNNPINFNDPSGHKYCDSEDPNNCSRYSSSIEDTALAYRIRFRGDWSTIPQLAVINAIEKVGEKLAGSRETTGESASEAFVNVYKGITFTWDENCYNCRSAAAIERCGNDFASDGCGAGGGYTYSPHKISFASMTGGWNNDIFRMTLNVVHELGHAFNGNSGNPAASMPKSFYINRDKILRPNTDGLIIWQQNPTRSNSETYADMFIAWNYYAWNTEVGNAVIVDEATTWFESTTH